MYDLDITERKLQEERNLKKVMILESQKRLEEIFEKVRMVGVTIDNNCHITHCNTNFLNLTGLKKQEVIGLDLFEMFLPESGTENQKEEFLEITKGGIFLDQFERIIKSKYGDMRTIQFNVVMISDADGLITGFSLVGKDVSENKRVVRALRETNKKLEDFFQNANDLIQIFSVDGTLNFVNQAWKDTLGYDDREIEKLKFVDIIAPESRNSTLNNLHKILHGEFVPDFESVFVSKEGKHIYVTCSVNCKIINGKASEFRGIFHNNTLKIRAERAQNLYYSIANLAVKSSNLEDLYIDIHKLLKQYIDVNNFHVAICDKDSTNLSFPYYVDENYPGMISSSSRIQGKGLTEYTLSQSKALSLYEEDILKLAEEGVVALPGRIPKVWLGVPLKVENTIIGLIAVKSYSDRNKYKQRHLEMLDFVSGQIAVAIERKINEERIANKTARLKSIFESSSHLMWSVNKQMTLTSFNHNYAEALKELYGKEPQLEVETQEPRLILSDDLYRDFVNEKYKLAFSGIPQHYETSVTNHEQKLIWRETYLNPIYTSQGTIEEVSGISHDITEKKNAELSIQESEEKFRNIFESFQDLYYRTDFYGNITLISPSVYELTGYTQEEMLGKKISDYYVNAKKQEKLLKELLRTGTVRNFEVSIRCKDGSEIQTISNIRVILNQRREPIATEGVARDITFLKKTEQDLISAKEVAEKSLKVKELFLANMSHEIRTPMNGVIGMIDLLDQTNLNDVQKDYVQTIKKSSETLLTILNDILDLSKIEAGKMQLKPTPIFLDHTLAKLFALFKQQAKIKEIDFSYSITPDVPRFIQADETRLLQILSNLTSNSIKFTDKGNVNILIEKLRTTKNGTHILKATISDTGIGMSQEQLPLLFNTFTQLDNTTTKSFSGTGLGLVISKQLCEMMNGIIGVKSKIGQGSTFWFTFEVPEIEPFEIINEIEQVSSQPVDFKGLKVLVVDDNVVNRKVATEILKSHNCVVDTAVNGIEAIEKVSCHDYGIVLMDIQMPVMDGVAATKEIKKIKGKKIPPIIAMTAYSMKEDKLKYLSLGMDDYVAKPIRVDTLLSKIKEWIADTDAIGFPDSIISPVLATHEIVDREVVAQLKKYGGEEGLREMWADFDLETSTLLGLSHKAFAHKDYLQLKSHIHTIKGSAGTLGINQVTNVATQLDLLLKQENYTSVESLLAELQKVFDEFLVYYKK
jgi:PAS domain S-box-containing protein